MCHGFLGTPAAGNRPIRNLSGRTLVTQAQGESPDRLQTPHGGPERTRRRLGGNRRRNRNGMASFDEHRPTEDPALAEGGGADPARAAGRRLDGESRLADHCHGRLLRPGPGVPSVPTTSFDEPASYTSPAETTFPTISSNGNQPALDQPQGSVLGVGQRHPGCRDGGIQARRGRDGPGRPGLPPVVGAGRSDRPCRVRPRSVRRQRAERRRRGHAGHLRPAAGRLARHRADRRHRRRELRRRHDVRPRRRSDAVHPRHLGRRRSRRRR